MLAWEVLACAFAVFRAWRTAVQDLKFWENPKISLNYLVFSQGALYPAPILHIGTEVYGVLKG